jgi:hypothetical protein
MKNWPFAGPETRGIYDRNELFNLLEGAGLQRSDIKIEELKLPLGINGLLAIATKSRRHCRIAISGLGMRRRPNGQNMIASLGSVDSYRSHRTMAARVTTAK